MNAEVSAQHLKMFLEVNPGVPILLFWDRAPWHRGKPIDKVLEEESSLGDHFLSNSQPGLEPARTCLESGPQSR